MDLLKHFGRCQGKLNKVLCLCALPPLLLLMLPMLSDYCLAAAHSITNFQVPSRCCFPPLHLGHVAAAASTTTTITITTPLLFCYCSLSCELGVFQSARRNLAPLRHLDTLTLHVDGHGIQHALRLLLV